MNKQFALFTHLVRKIDRQHIQLVLTLVSLAMLVIGVGAPTDGAGGGPR
jgi:hypothetical protein